MTTNDTLTIQLLDVIGADFFGDGITAAAVQRELAKAPKAKLIAITMNSPGGDAFEGTAIANLLRQHGARVELDVIGMAASAATIVAMAADHIRMGAGAMMMIHEATGYVRGPASLLRARADMLHGINTGVADAYAGRMDSTRDEALALMQAETWFTAEAAVEVGLADAVADQPPGRAAAAIASVGTPFTRLGYRNVPAPITAAMTAITKPDDRPAWETMTYAELTNMERHALCIADRRRFDRMRDEWIAAGSPLA